MMKNRLEQLTGANKTNYEQYLQRMTQSISQSSKGLIPFFAYTSKRILDVGCGSGILMHAIKTVNPEAAIVGIDINQSAVDTCISQGLDVKNSNLHDFAKSGEKFDCIIFSSVLHEFSSYDESRAFMEEPISEAIEDAWKLLEFGGIIIIRDGIRADKSMRNGNVKITFINSEDSIWVERFKKDFPDYRNVVFEEGVLSTEDAKEFLYTFTWGEKSWNREVQERFGILSVARWKELIRNNGFDIKNFMTSSEEYKEYLKPKIEISDEIDRLLEETTILVIAEKHN